MTHRLLIPVTPGELLDRITILRTKLRNISDRGKLAKVGAELAELTYVWDASPYAVRTPAEVIHCIRELAEVHQQIWDAENAIRGTLRPDELSATPIAAAASMGREGNDKRTELKARINAALDQETTEVKEYGGTHEADKSQGQGS